MKTKYLFFALFSVVFFRTQAQVCTATNAYGCGSIALGDIRSLLITDLAGNTLYSNPSISCSGSTSKNTVLNAGNPITVYAGQTLVFYLTSKDSYPLKYTQAGVWLDMNRNDTLEAADCIADPQSGPLSRLKEATSGVKITIPCFSQTGKSYLRLRGSSSFFTVLNSDGCGTINTFGNILDLEVNLKKFPNPSADFNLPVRTVYTGTKQNFTTKTDNPDYSVQWSFSFASSVIQSAGLQGTAAWNAPGTYDVKCKVSYCGYADSVTKSVTVIAPTAKPVAGFYADPTKVEIYYQWQLFDTSSNGPTSWSWTVTSPANQVYTSNQQNPIFMADESGWWDVCLEVSNLVGSSKSCKYKYLLCHPPLSQTMGANKYSNWEEGIIYDNGGPDLDYSNNRKYSNDYFQIESEDSFYIDLQIDYLDLKDTGELLQIFDGPSENGKPMHPGSGYTVNGLVSSNSKIRCTSGHAFLRFRSNGSGTDSGFRIRWIFRKFRLSSGTVYFDADTNCNYKGKDLPLFGIKVQMPMNHLQSRTDMNGNYYIFSDTQKQEVEILPPPDLSFTCPVNGKDTWDYQSNRDMHFGLKKGTAKMSVTHDVDVLFGPEDGYSSFRTQRDKLYLQITNKGNRVENKIKCHISSSKKLDNWQANYTPINHTDTSIEFEFNALSELDYRLIKFGGIVGKKDTGKIAYHCHCYGDTADTDSSNNEGRFTKTIRRPYDPNYKEVSVQDTFISKNQEFEYYVHFQNTGEAPAIDVLVADTLSNELDYSSVELGLSSHPMVLEQRNNHLYFHFINIYLPDSHSSFSNSQGWFYYKVKPAGLLKPYATIQNSASIYFDDELPVRTRTTRNTWVALPALTLKGASVMNLPLCAVFTDPGATALDAETGQDLSHLIAVSGQVQMDRLTPDTLVYSVTSPSGFHTEVRRIVRKQDAVAPHITRSGKWLQNNAVIKVQAGSVFTDSVQAVDSCTGVIPVKAVPGYNGPVNSSLRGIYPVSYAASDDAGNKAVENGYTLWYRVEDFISPEIQFTTHDTVFVALGSVYTAVNPLISDNFYALNQISVVKSGYVNTQQRGFYSEVWTATDGSGNTASKVRYVWVYDPSLPRITGNPMRVCVGQGFWAYSGIKVEDEYFDGEALLSQVKITASNVNIWVAGDYKISYQLNYSSGKTIQYERDVLVRTGPGCSSQMAGVDGAENEDVVRLFPNPTKGLLTLQWNREPVGNGMISVYNLQGKCIQKESFDVGSGNTITLHIGQHVPDGLYYVEIRHAEGVMSKKVILSR
ncbi:MAG: DUF5011 domain-containing protein [Bacteroidetes bacterium]|nr:DUF5011 domain-containing protein [Bacteroidota bacterium]